MGLKIVVFEHEASFAIELKHELSKFGCDVKVIDDGIYSLESMEHFVPDLILLTIELPHINGFSICNKIKKEPQFKEIPLIVLSSEASDETFEQHKKLRTHADDYIRKPIAVRELLQRIQMLVPALQEQSREELSEEDILVADVEEERFNEPIFDSPTQHYTKENMSAHFEKDPISIHSSDASTYNNLSGPASVTTNRLGASARDVLELREALNRKDKEILDLKEQLYRAEKEIIETRDKLFSAERFNVELDETLTEIQQQFIALQQGKIKLVEELEQAHTKEHALNLRIHEFEENEAHLRHELERTHTQYNAFEHSSHEKIQTLELHLMEQQNAHEKQMQENAQNRDHRTSLEAELAQSQSELKHIRHQLEKHKQETAERWSRDRALLERAKDGLAEALTRIEEVEERSNSIQPNVVAKPFH